MVRRLRLHLLWAKEIRKVNDVIKLTLVLAPLENWWRVVGVQNVEDDCGLRRLALAITHLYSSDVIWKATIK